MFLFAGRPVRPLRMAALAVCVVCCWVLVCFWVGTAHAQQAEPEEAAAAPASDKSDEAGKVDEKSDVPDVKQACVDSFGQSQSLRLAGKLLEARKDLVRCGQAHCPELIRVKCVPWLEEVTHNIPSLVIDARDGEGGDLVDVRVSVDGELVRKELDGTDIQLDPGPRELRFEYGGQTKTLKLVMRQGEKNRVVRVVFTPPKKPKRKPKPKANPDPETGEGAEEGGVSKIAWVGFGVGGVALAAGVITGAVALVKGDELEDECQEDYLSGELQQDVCHAAQQDDLRAGEVVAHISTVSFAVAGAGVAMGVIGLLVGRGDDEDDDGKDEGARWRPLLGPAFAGVSARW
jgi:hypothetical protein